MESKLTSFSHLTDQQKTDRLERVRKLLQSDHLTVIVWERVANLPAGNAIRRTFHFNVDPVALLDAAADLITEAKRAMLSPLTKNLLPPSQEDNPKP